MARLDPKHFTRCRTLTLPTVLSFLLSSVHAVQSELDQFFANLRNRADSVREVTAQAFYQARYKINALVFGEVKQHLMGLVEEHLPIPRWRGLRVVAVDGSAVRLTMMKDTRVRHFSRAIRINGASVPMKTRSWRAAENFL